MTTASLIAKYDRPVPRYTSYPTAPHFHAGIDPATHADWLAALSPDAPLSLYIHVPFCRQMCWYCGCNTQIVARHQPIADFVESLIAEIELVGRHLAAGGFTARRQVAAIHFGGGTPNSLGADEFRRLMMALGHVFELDADLDLALELDPRGLDVDFLAAMREMGVRRVSLGVQDFDPAVQQAINRVQPFDLVARAVEDLRTAGIGTINFDLIYGLPLQSTASMARTAQLTAQLRPDRVALFGYAHVPWMKAHQRLIDADSLPDATQRFAQFTIAADILATHGYRQIGLDHFALPEDALAIAEERATLRRNFQGYAVDRADTLLGFGPSAISSLPWGYLQNQPDNTPWARAIADGRLATVKGIALTADDRLRRDVIDGIMCRGTADLSVLPLNAGAELSRLAPLIADGLVELKSGRLRLTARGAPFRRIVAAMFDAYLQQDSQRHSRAV
jgi:oxygen-independent coproporphyrinogen-3 oxidase